LKIQRLIFTPIVTNLIYVRIEEEQH
jgi:hypothetical protein